MTTTPIKLSSPLTWIDGPKLGRKKRRATIAPQVWENHYLRIEQLYRAEDRPLKYVAQYMKDNHGFDATERQYHTQFEKWGLFKRSGQRKQVLPPQSPISLTEGQSPGSSSRLLRQATTTGSLQSPTNPLEEPASRSASIEDCSSSNQAPSSPGSPGSPSPAQYGATRRPSRNSHEPVLFSTAAAPSKSNLQSVLPIMLNAGEHDPKSQDPLRIVLMEDEYSGSFAAADQKSLDELLLGFEWPQPPSGLPTTPTSTFSDGISTSGSVSTSEYVQQDAQSAARHQQEALEDHVGDAFHSEKEGVDANTHDKPPNLEDEPVQTRSVSDKTLENSTTPVDDGAPQLSASATTTCSDVLDTQQHRQSLIAEVLLRDGSDASQIDVSISQLTLSQRYKIPGVLSHVSLKPSTTLEDMVTVMLFKVDTASVSTSDIVKLVRTAKFLFAAQAYEHCHAISVFTWRLVQDNDRSDTTLSTLPVWPEIAVNTIKSSNLPQDLRLCGEILNAMPLHGALHSDCVRKDLAILYACLGEALHRLSSDSEADKAAVECWTTSQSMASTYQHSLAHTAITAATKHITQHINNKPLPPDTYKQLNRVLEASGQSSPSCEEANRHMYVILIWCATSLGHAGFASMISNIDAKFWTTNGVDVADVRRFERLVAYSYLCGCLWRHERLDKCKELCRIDADVVGALENLQSATGLTSEDILAAILQLLFHPGLASVNRLEQATMATRYHARMDDVCRQFALKAAGFQHHGRTLTMELLLEHFQWPGRSYYVNCDGAAAPFCSTEYATSVGTFLREFASIGLELGESKVLQPVLTCFHAGRALFDETLLPYTARSSQTSDDLKAFRSAGRRRSDESMQSMTPSLQRYSAAFDDLLSEGFDDDRLLRYSGSVKSHNSGSNMSISGASLRGSTRMSTSGSSVRSSRLEWFPRSSLAGSSVMEVDED